MDSEHTDSAESVQDTPARSAGAQLRAAREELRLDLAHIAAETRIPLRHLEAVEAGNFEALPSRAYAIGFARTFATAVGLDSAKITDVVRSELADGSMRRNAPVSGMEPGDPARLPSAGLAWAGALAALVFAVGAFAFYNSYFGAGREPGPLVAPAPAASSKPAAQPGAVSTATGEVVLTALEDGVWLRLYEEGGERLIERTLKLGETVLVPGDAADPRINTGRPDALSITVGGKTVAKLSDRPTTLSGAPVSAVALLARTAPRSDEVAIAQTGSGSGSGSGSGTGAGQTAPLRPAVRRPVRQLSAPAASSGAAAQPAADAPSETGPEAAPEPEPAGN
jgi:cytoskeleton protein RodZ